jgi:hypothetical protein
MSSLRQPFPGITLSTPNVSVTPTNWPTVQKTPVTSYPPILNPLGPNFLNVNNDETLLCFDNTYGKEDRICSKPISLSNPASLENAIFPQEDQFKKIIAHFLNAINVLHKTQVTSEDLTLAISFTTPKFRETWNGPQKISNISNFQDYLFGNLSPFLHLTRVSQWRSEIFDMEPNFFTARMQIDTLDHNKVSHRYVFEFKRNTDFDTVFNTLPELEWKINKIYPPMGNMDDFF